MKLNYFAKRLSTLGCWLATALLCLSASAFIWQGALVSDATAAPAASLIAAADLDDQVRGKTREDAGRAKNFIRDTADSVERTAQKNAERVDRADDQGGFFERKARKDAARIYQRSEEDAARTEKAVDNTKNAVERAVDGIKNAFD